MLSVELILKLSCIGTTKCNWKIWKFNSISVWVMPGLVCIRIVVSCMRQVRISPTALFSPTIRVLHYMTIMDELCRSMCMSNARAIRMEWKLHEKWAKWRRRWGIRRNENRRKPTTDRSLQLGVCVCVPPLLNFINVKCIVNRLTFRRTHANNDVVEQCVRSLYLRCWILPVADDAGVRKILYF